MPKPKALKNWILLVLALLILLLTPAAERQALADDPEQDGQAESPQEETQDPGDDSAQVDPARLQDLRYRVREYLKDNGSDVLRCIEKKWGKKWKSLRLLEPRDFVDLAAAELLEKPPINYLGSSSDFNRCWYKRTESRIFDAYDKDKTRRKYSISVQSYWTAVQRRSGRLLDDAMPYVLVISIVLAGLARMLNEYQSSRSSGYGFYPGSSIAMYRSSSTDQYGGVRQIRSTQNGAG